MKRVYADLGLLTTAVIWGATFPVVKVALNSISPFAFNTVRFFLSSLLFLPFFKRGGWKEGIKIGFATFLGYSFQTLGLEYTTATNAGFITSLYVVLAPLLAHLLYKMPIKTLDTISLIIAIFGFYLLSGYTGFMIGDILILLCAFGFAMEVAMISHYSRRINPTMLAFWQVFAVAIFSVPLSLITTERFVINADVVYALIVTVLLATFVAKLFQNWFQRYVKVAEASIILSLEGVFSHIFSFLILGETLTFVQYVGASLIVLAVILISFKE